MYKQIIIARKDLNMSPGKLAAQVSHGSMAFLTSRIKEEAFAITKGMLAPWGSQPQPYWKEVDCYESDIIFEKDLFEQWINGSFTKCVLQARNKSNLIKAKTMAEELGLVEGVDFFLIRDNCMTELTPEDEDGRTLTCIGFKPMDADVIDKIGRKYHLYM